MESNRSRSKSRFGVRGVNGDLAGFPVIDSPETDSRLFLLFLSKYVGVRVGDRKIAPGDPRASSSKVGKLVNRPVGDLVGVFTNCYSGKLERKQQCEWI